MKKIPLKILQIISLLYLIVFPGCAYLSINQRDNYKEGRTQQKGKEKIILYNSSVIRGKVITYGKENNPVLIIASPYSFQETKPANYVILKKPGPYLLYLPKGKYQIYCITDFNNNAVFEQRETSAVYSNGKILDIMEGDLLNNIDLTASARNSKKAQYPNAIRIQDDYDHIAYQSFNGEVSKIYDEKFSHENAEIGQWNPSAFMKVLGANIYLTEKYDPDKIPVLFVHGMGGSPWDWAYFYMRLDKKRFQPWFYYYPSGLRLSLNSRLLYENLIELYQKYKFKKMYITAHSMGGLLTRSLLTQYNFNEYNNFVRLFITLATPWTGFRSADFARSLSDKVLPSWIDIGSRSSFIKRTMRLELPKNISYYLFYGKTDSTSKSRALDSRAYKEAKGTFGYNCDHNTILINKDVFKKYRTILNYQDVP